MGFHSAGFHRHYLQKEIALFMLGKRNYEIVDSDATMVSQKSSSFLTGNSVADFQSKYIVTTVGTLRRSPSPSWCSMERKSHYRFICLQYWNVQCSSMVPIHPKEEPILEDDCLKHFYVLTNCKRSWFVGLFCSTAERYCQDLILVAFMEKKPIFFVVMSLWPTSCFFLFCLSTFLSGLFPYFSMLFLSSALGFLIKSDKCNPCVIISD